MIGSGMAMAALFGVGAVLASLYLYRTRELPVKGRTAFALLRAATLTLVVLLLLDPLLPGSVVSGRRAVVDGSASMQATIADGTRPADAATSWAAEFPEPEVETTERVSEAVARAIEGGAGEVMIATDLRLPDGVSLRALASRASARISVVDVGGPVDNAGISGLELPDRIRPGETARATMRVHGQGTAQVYLVVAGDTLARTSVVLESGGRERTVGLEFTLPDEIDADYGALIVEAVVGMEGDGYAPDDRRLGLLALDEPGGGLVALSAQPDWEFRTLLPVLDEVVGVPVQGFLKLSEGRYLTTGENPSVVPPSAVREALAAARLTLLHAFPAEDPDDPVLALARRSDRILEIAPRGVGQPGLGTPQPGEWYVAAELPSSPIAAELAGIPLLGLPPLSALRPGEPEGPSPLALQRGGSGAAVPAFSWMDEGETRRVVARAEGFWRWGMRDGAPRDLYRRLWSGVTSWLLTPSPGARATGLGPAQAEVAPGAPVEIRAGLLAGGRVQLQWSDGGATEDSTLDAAPDGAGADSPGAGSTGMGTTRIDTLEVDSIGRATAPSFDRAGVLAWRASGVAGPDSIAASGLLIVQGPGDELRIPRDTTLADDLRALARDAELAAAGQPLRSHPLPWILLVLLLSGEWVGRRRSGLR